MDRRRLITAALAGAGAAAAGGARAQGPASGAVRRLRMVTTWPKNFPGLGTSPERLARRIRAATDGALDITVYAAGELVGAFEAFDAVAAGNADAYNGAEAYWQGKSKAYNFFNNVPFGMTAPEFNAWIYYGGGQQLWDELGRRFNLKPFLTANTGTQWGGWFRHRIRTVGDIKGLKIRIPGLGGEVWRRMGATAVAIPGGETFAALQSGLIDAVEWVGPWNDLAFGFHKVLKYYYWPGFQAPSSGESTAFNLDVWNSLTPPHQAAIESACAAENAATRAEFAYHNGLALRTLKERHGVRLRAFPEPVYAAFAAATRQVMADVAAGDTFTARVHASFKRTLDSVAPLSRRGQAAFLERRDA